jgi:hypothetical protein
MRKVVGISQKIKRSWLDAALDRLVETTEKAKLRSFMDDHLSAELPSEVSKAKAIGIILRIWSGIPTERIALRHRAIALVPRISGQERIWLHWGMTSLAYPFFRDTAEVIGRLLALQNDFTTGQVQGRIVTEWGDRTTSKEATQKLITSLLDWGVLESETQGHFLSAKKMTASIPELQVWFLEAMLTASLSDEIEVSQLLRLPELFPFKLNIAVTDIRKHDGFNIHRQGLDTDMVALRKIEPEQPRKVKAKRLKPGQPVQPSIFDKQAEDLIPTTISNSGKPGVR